jgi:hypothetical protein
MRLKKAAIAYAADLPRERVLLLDTLKLAQHVTFVGYSLPITDIAAGTLFREALGHLRPSAHTPNSARTRND